MQVNYIIKNKVSEQDFEATVYDWLSDGDYTPNDIIENIITGHNLMYFPIHFYRSNYKGAISAELGYDRTEYYTIYNSTTRKHENRTRTVTDWRPFRDSNVSGETAVSTYVGEAKFEFIKNFIQNTGWEADDLNRLAEDAALNSKMVDLFDMNIGDAWNQLGLQQSYKRASSFLRLSLPSNQVRNFRANLNFEVTNSFSLVVPFWVFLYKYQDKEYYVSVDGNNPKRIDGVRPQNKKRKYTVWAIRSIGWLLTIYLGYIAALTYNEKNDGTDYNTLITITIFIAVIAALGYAFEGIIRNIKNKSKQIRKNKLDAMRRNQLEKK